MQKDGHSCHRLKEQAFWAELIAEREGRTPEERASLKKRLLHKWMGK